MRKPLNIDVVAEAYFRPIDFESILYPTSLTINFYQRNTFCLGIDTYSEQEHENVNILFYS